MAELEWWARQSPRPEELLVYSEKLSCECENKDELQSSVQERRRKVSQKRSRVSYLLRIKVYQLDMRGYGFGKHHSQAQICSRSEIIFSFSYLLILTDQSNISQQPISHFTHYCCSCYCCSVAKLHLTLCDPTDWSIPGFPVLHLLLEFVPTHVYWVCDYI